MSDLIALVRAAVNAHEAERCECYQMANNNDSPVCSLLSVTAVSAWLRALLARCEVSESSYQEAQLTIAGLEAERDHYRSCWTVLRQCHAEAVEAAFKEAYGEGPGPSADAAWLASEARKAVAHE